MTLDCAAHGPYLLLKDFLKSSSIQEFLNTSADIVNTINSRGVRQHNFLTIVWRVQLQPVLWRISNVLVYIQRKLHSLPQLTVHPEAEKKIEPRLRRVILGDPLFTHASFFSCSSFCSSSSSCLFVLFFHLSTFLLLSLHSPLIFFFVFLLGFFLPLLLFSSSASFLLSLSLPLPLRSYSALILFLWPGLRPQQSPIEAQSKLSYVHSSS